MSVAGAQYDKFREQVVAEERAFSFTDGGQLLVYPVRTGQTVPFWSSRSRLEAIQKRLPKYRQWQITEFPLWDFWRRLDRLEREGVQVGVNWSGPQLTGYNVSVRDLRAGLRYWIDQLGKGNYSTSWLTIAEADKARLRTARCARTMMRALQLSSRR